MNYAKWISDDLIQLPVAEDYLEDGVTLKNPEEWLEYMPSSMPTDGTLFKSYVAKYMLLSDMPMSGNRRIIQVWRAVYFEPEGRVAKLEGNELVFPQRNEKNKDGQLVCNYNNLPNSKKLLDGWLLIEETLYPTDGKVYRETGTLIEDAILGHKIKIVWIEVPDVTTVDVFAISKYKLRLQFRSIGKEDELDLFLNSSPTLAKDWADAVTLDSNNPLVVSACEAFKASMGMTDDQIKAILNACRSDI